MVKEVRKWEMRGAKKYRFKEQLTVYQLAGYSSLVYIEKGHCPHLPKILVVLFVRMSILTNIGKVKFYCDKSKL